VQVVALGAINAPMYSMKGPTMLKASYSPAFPLKHQQKVSQPAIFRVLRF
jgi:glyoxylate/succinic semialdehyde reductase